MKYIIIKAFCKLFRISDEKTCEMVNSWFRKNGMKVGYNCHIYSNIGKAEAYLIEIGDNVTISNDVQIITHDNSIIKLIDNMTDYFGKVIIQDDCFIGARAIILPGVTIGKNSIVGAGSVVTRSVEDYCVVAGNPAKKICDVDQFREKIRPFGVDYSELCNKKDIVSVLEKEGKLIIK